MGEYGNSVTFVSGGTLGSKGTGLDKYRYWHGVGTSLLSSEPYRMCIYAPHRGEFSSEVYDGTAVWGYKTFRNCYTTDDCLVFSVKKNKDDSDDTFIGSELNFQCTREETIYSYNGLTGNYDSGESSADSWNSSKILTTDFRRWSGSLPYLAFPLNDTWHTTDDRWPNFYFTLYNVQDYRDSYTIANWSCVMNLPIFYDESKAAQFVNGLIDEDEADVPPHDFDADENDENDNDTNASKYEPTPSNTPQVRPTDIQGASNYYCVNAANVNAFVNWLWNDLIKEGSLSDWLLDSITKINGNLYSCITGLRLFPCNISKHLAVTQPTGINLGRFTTEFTVIDARSYNPKIGELEYTIPAGYNNFLDYQPYTTGLLYLPFVGFTQLDMTVFQPKSTMKIECYVDITTGVIDYVIYLKTDKGYSLIEHHSGTCGIEIPMSYDNASNWLQNFVGGAIKDGVNTIGGKGATSLGEMAISATGGLLDSFDTPTSYNVGSPSPSNGLYFPFKPHIVIKRPTYSRPKSYSKNVGYPCMKSLRPKSLSGYTVFQNPQLTFGHTVNSEGQKVLPTKEEMDMLYQLMTEGVYL